jgi:hypothetical protein
MSNRSKILTLLTILLLSSTLIGQTCGLCGHCPCGWPPGKSCGSPIVIDTRGDAFEFTDPNTQCVRFDLKNDGKPGCYSWPKQGVALLVRDIDKDHVIDSGDELFGNFSAQPPLPPAFGDGNGFTALSLLNSNSDLVIDKHDSRWSSLRFWKPEHCLETPDVPCKSIPSELSSLESNNVCGLSVVYRASTKIDQWGNAFAWEGHFIPCEPKDGQTNNVMYDVYLVQGGNR